MLKALLNWTKTNQSKLIVIKISKHEAHYQTNHQKSMKRKMDSSIDRPPCQTRLNNASDHKMQLQSPNKLSNIVFLSNGYLSSPKSLVFVFEQKRILVNCGEGTQRLIYSNSIRMRHIDSILLTRFDWQCAGGLRGLSMGMLDTVAQVNASAAENSGSSKPSARSQHHQSHQHRMAPVRIHCPVDLHLDNEGLSLKKHLVEKAIIIRLLIRKKKIR